MASIVDICNLALTELGEKHIVSLSEESKAARLCKLFYDVERDSLLRSQNWNFSLKRIELAQLTTSPSFGYGNSFQLPVDCLKVVKTDDTNDSFVVEGLTLLSDNASVSIVYISRITDPTLFDSLFIEALYQRLASKLAYNLSDNNTLVQIMDAKYKQTMRKASSMDGQEGVIDGLETNLWLNSRL